MDSHFFLLRTEDAPPAPPATPHPSPPHAGQSKLVDAQAFPSADGVQNLPSRWSMRRPFVTFIILVPDGRSAVEVANKAIMSLLMLAISAVGPARCMNVRASMRNTRRVRKVALFAVHGLQ